MSSQESSDESSSASSVVAYEDPTNGYESTSSNNNENGARQDTNDNNSQNDNSELAQLKRECRAMMTLLKRLRQQEEDLRQKNIALAREALLCGFQMDALEAARSAPKRRAVTKSAATRKDDGNKAAS